MERLILFSFLGPNWATYIEEVLESHVMPYADFVGESFVLMHDTGRRTYLREVGIPIMEWPAWSPDFNPIERLRGELKKRIRARHPVVQSLQELKVTIEEEWDDITKTSSKH